jgi:hypothetical protein
VKETQRLAKARQIGTIIVGASAPIGKYVFPEVKMLKKQGYEVSKVAKNMINFSRQRIHAHLAEMGLVPEQKRAAA